MECAECGISLDPEDHAGMVCDGEVFCQRCRLYDRRLLEPRSFEEIMDWHQRLCRSIDCVPPALALGKPPPPPGAFDFLEDKKLLMAEAYHQERIIVLYPPGLRLATLCHELAHLLTGHDHTVAWARTFAGLVARVKEQLPPDHYTAGMRINLLKPTDG